MKPFQTLDYAKPGGDVAVITLDRPAAINAYNVRMRDELHELLSVIEDDPDVRGVLFKGAGDQGFCAGADLTEFGTAPTQAIARRVRWERDVWGRMLAMRKPLVAAIHGFCLGSGMEIAALCDVRIASEDAVFGMPETGWGLIAAAGGTQMLPRLLGPGAALDLLLTGRRLDAREAFDLGFVTQVTPREHLETEALSLLSRILAAPSASIAAAKRAVTEGAELPLEVALALERRLGAELS
ncbi:MAG: enoyl-CoA hydratase/isomerase family protein [Dehalococcoidia bacterium]